MLGKLFKHEFMTIGRIALPTYGAMLVLSLIGRFLTWILSRKYIYTHVPKTFVKILQVLSSLVSTVYVIAFIALIILTLVYIVMRFYRNFFTDEGYLMHTLPVRPISLVFSKLFNAWIWIFFSVAIALLSLYITLGHYDQLTDVFHQLIDSIQDVTNREGSYLREELGVPVWVFVIEVVVFLFLLMTRYLVSWYGAVSFGMMISKKHKLFGTLVAYLIVENVSNMFMGVFFGIITKIAPSYYGALASSGGKALQATVLGGSAIDLIFSVLLLWFITFIFRHRLNLD